MTKKRIWIGVLVVLVGIFVYAFSTTSRAGYETAPYEVIEKSGPLELRAYEALELVSTPVSSDSSNGSFRKLFRYISGDNESGDKIAMTTPVFMPAGADGEMREMQFVVPADVAAKGAPEPDDERVRLERRDAGRYAALRYPGRSTDRKREERLAELRQWIEERGWEVVGKPIFAGYDPPWTPGPMRRNEVLIPVR